jgi:hypothetical protein
MGGFVNLRAGLDAVANRKKSLPFPSRELKDVASIFPSSKFVL